MSCTSFENWIALYVEGDLARRKARRLERHLDECPACRDLAASLKESQQALKSLRSEAFDGAALEQVRSRVLGELAARAQAPSWFYRWDWRFALAGLLLATALGVTVWRVARREAPKPNSARITVESPLPRPPTAGVVPAAPVRKATRRRAAHGPKLELARTPAEAIRAESHQASEPLMVKLVTDDPDVVIIWLVDRNGG